MRTVSGILDKITPTSMFSLNKKSDESVQRESRENSALVELLLYGRLENKFESDNIVS